MISHAQITFTSINPPSANFFRLLCSVHLPQKVRGIFGLKAQKTGPGLTVIAIPKPVFSDFTVFFLVLAPKARKLPDLSGRQIRQLVWQREKDSNPHIRSQSPLCYHYTIPLCWRTKTIIRILRKLSTPFCISFGYFYIASDLLFLPDCGIMYLA